MIAVVLSIALTKAFDHFSSLKIPSLEQVTFFRQEADKSIPVIAIDSAGHLIVDIPGAMKQYTAQQAEIEKAKKSQVVPKK